MAELRALRLIAAAMRSFAQKYPQVNFDLRTAVRRDALNLVDQHGFDFALLVRPADTKACNVLTLDPECCWGLIVKADSELGRKPSIGAAELKEVPLIMSRSELDDRTFEGWLGYPLKELRSRASYNLLNNGCRLVEADLGAAVCLSGIVDKLPDGLTFVPFAPRLCVSSSLVWQKGRRLTKAAELFLQEIKAQLI